MSRGTDLTKAEVATVLGDDVSPSRHPARPHSSWWVQTYTGRQYFPMTPRVQDVCIEDIAHSLSLICRFNGACRVYYSVAQHCVLASRLVSSPNRLWALLHDAAEAYLGDIVRPVKRGLIPGYKELEAENLRVIGQAFGLTSMIPEEVWRVDDMLLATERRDLLAPCVAEWTDQDDPLDITIDPWLAHRAEHEFIAEFHALNRVW